MKSADLARIAIPAILIAVSAALTATAAEYPTKPIRLIVGFAPGGGTDTTARESAASSPSCSDSRSSSTTVRAPPEISPPSSSRRRRLTATLLMGTIAALAINPSLYTTKLPFDSIKDFAPITQAVDSTNILSLHPSVPAGSVKELIALAKAKPLNYGSSGVGGTGHLAGELFNTMAGVKMTHIRKGGGPAMIDLVGGQVQLVLPLQPAPPQIKGADQGHRSDYRQTLGADA